MNDQEFHIKQGRKIYLEDHAQNKTSERSENYLYNALYKKRPLPNPNVARAMKDPAIAELVYKLQSGELQL